VNASVVDRRSILFVSVIALLCAAPTVGDIGSCDERADPLGAPEFFGARVDLECGRCNDCGLSTRECTNVCLQAKNKTFPHGFPEGCHPVIHDGEVCLHALDALSCSGFADVVSDAPIVPTECDFCPPPPPATDGGS